MLAWELLERKKPWTGKSEHQIHHALVQGERLPRPEAPVVPELADWAVECFGVAAERPTMHALETKLDELLSTDERDLDTLRARLAEAQRGDADAYVAQYMARMEGRAASSAGRYEAPKYFEVADVDEDDYYDDAPSYDPMRLPPDDRISAAAMAAACRSSHASFLGGS